MTDFEKAILFSEFLNTANFVFSNYMAIVFAMLTVSFFLASKMTNVVATLFLLLYSIGALMAGSGVYFAFSDFAGLGGFIHHTSEGSETLKWLGPAGPGGANMSMMPGFVLFMLIAAYAGSLAFFFAVRLRRVEKKSG